jgi:hypothetical protein
MNRPRKTSVFPPPEVLKRWRKICKSFKPLDLDEASILAKRRGISTERYLVEHARRQANQLLRGLGGDVSWRRAFFVLAAARLNLGVVVTKAERPLSGQKENATKWSLEDDFFLMRRVYELRQINGQISFRKAIAIITPEVLQRRKKAYKPRWSAAGKSTDREIEIVRKRWTNIRSRYGDLSEVPHLLEVFGASPADPALENSDVVKKLAGLNPGKNKNTAD